MLYNYVTMEQEADHYPVSQDAIDMTNGLHAHDRPRVLLVDPNPNSQQTITELLASRYQVVGAQSLAAADAFLNRDLPVVLLVEPDEPDGDGFVWIRHLRASATYQNLAIACVTSRSSVRDKVDGMMAGADDYLVKPIMEDTFLTKIRLLQRLRQIHNNYP
jgi:DNA-binding response OmpR family regulator